MAFGSCPISSHISLSSQYIQEQSKGLAFYSQWVKCHILAVKCRLKYVPCYDRVLLLFFCVNWVLLEVVHMQFAPLSTRDRSLLGSSEWCWYANTTSLIHIHPYRLFLNDTMLPEGSIVLAREKQKQVFIELNTLVWYLTKCLVLWLLV